MTDTFSTADVMKLITEGIAQAKRTIHDRTGPMMAGVQEAEICLIRELHKRTAPLLLWGIPVVIDPGMGPGEVMIDRLDDGQTRVVASEQSLESLRERLSAHPRTIGEGKKF